MKIKGIKGGKDRGEIIEYTPQDKVPHAVQQALAVGGHSSHLFDGFLCLVDKKSASIEKINYSPVGEPLKGKWQNNVYSAEGEVRMNRVHIATDTAREPKVIKFRIRFRDVLDDMGQPDLSIDHFELR